MNAQLAAENISVLRIAGTDYTDTSVQLADFELNPNVYTANGLNEGLGWGLRCGDQTGITLTHGEGPSGFFYDDPASYHVGTHECFYAALARGDYFADALTSSVFTGNVAHFGSTPFFTGPEPVLLTENPSTVGTYLTGFLNQAGSPYGIDPTGIAAPLTYETDGQAPLGLTVFGGIEALPQTTVQTALNAISAASSQPVAAVGSTSLHRQGGVDAAAVDADISLRPSTVAEPASWRNCGTQSTMSTPRPSVGRIHPPRRGLCHGELGGEEAYPGGRGPSLSCGASNH